MRFQGVILRLLRLEIYDGFLKPSERDMVSIRFYSFSFAESVRGCVSLKKKKSQGKAVEVTVNS